MQIALRISLAYLAELPVSADRRQRRRRRRRVSASRISSSGWLAEKFRCYICATTSPFQRKSRMRAVTPISPSRLRQPSHQPRAAEAASAPAKLDQWHRSGRNGGCGNLYGDDDDDYSSALRSRETSLFFQTAATQLQPATSSR